MKENSNLKKVQDDRSDLPILSEVMYKYAEDSITDEQVQRMLDPVIQMINEGKFNKPQRRHYTWHILYGALILEIAIAVLLIIMLVQHFVPK